MDNEKCKDGKKCCCPCHKVNGVLIALIGLSFLLGHLEVISEKIVGIAWPVLLILLGLKNSFGKSKCKCCSEA